jgi:hypothetical protein
MNNVRAAMGWLMVLAMVVSVRAEEPRYGAASSTYDVKATVDSFTGTANSLPFSWMPGDEQVRIVFEIAAMETGKKKRDEEMRHMFHADTHPLIVGTAAAADVFALSPGEDPVELPLKIEMHGITRDVTGMVTEVERADGELAFTIAFPLVLSAHDLKAPSIMMVIRVADDVKVTARVSLSTTPPEKAAVVPAS